MSDWPLLSLVTFLPLVGVAFILLIRGEPDDRRPQQPQRGAVDVARHLRRCR